MLTRKLLLSALTLAAVVLTTSAARADVIIDNFFTPDPAATYSLSAAVPDTFNRTDGLAGGITRDLTVTQTQNLLGLAGQTSGAIGTTGLGGVFALGTNPGATAFARLLYTNATPQDLSAGGTALVFTFLSTDLNIPFSVTVSDGTNSSTQIGTVSSTTSFSFDLSGFAGVNLANVTSIEFLLNQNAMTAASTQSADFTITDIRVTTPSGVVPAPPAALLALAALPVLGAWRMAKARKTVAA